MVAFHHTPSVSSAGMVRPCAAPTPLIAGQPSRVDGAAERFYPRIAWRAYPQAAPSVLFAEGIGGKLGVACAWPRIAGYR